MSSPSLPLLVIPYEIVVREIDGAVLLAHLYSRYGGKTLIGQKSSLFPLIPCLKGSIWFLKSIVPGEIYLSKKLKDNNCRILSYDVEGLVPSEGSVGILQRFSEESLSYVDQHFCWSFDEYQRYISVFPNLKDKFSVSVSLFRNHGTTIVLISRISVIVIFCLYLVSPLHAHSLLITI